MNAINNQEESRHYALLSYDDTKVFSWFMHMLVMSKQINSVQ